MYSSERLEESSKTNKNNELTTDYWGFGPFYMTAVLGMSLQISPTSAFTSTDTWRRQYLPATTTMDGMYKVLPRSFQRGLGMKEGPSVDTIRSGDVCMSQLNFTNDTWDVLSLTLVFSYRQHVLGM